MRVIVLSIALVTSTTLAANGQTASTHASQRDKGIHPAGPAVGKFAFGTPTSVTRAGFAKVTVNDNKPDRKKYPTANRADSVDDRILLIWSTSFSWRLSMMS